MAFIISTLRSASKVEAPLPSLNELSGIPIFYPEGGECSGRVKFVAQPIMIGQSQGPVEKESPKAAPKFLPLTPGNVDLFCQAIGDRLTLEQQRQAACFLNEYARIGSSDVALSDAIMILKTILGIGKTAEEYTAEIEQVLQPLLTKGNCYDPARLANPKLYGPAIRLLKELQGKEFPNDKRYQRYKNYLNDCINKYAESQLKQFATNPQELKNAPVGIQNTDAKSCYICAWMQLVANNLLLRTAYSQTFANANKILDDYDLVQMGQKSAVDSIGKMRGVLGAGEQQDANELISCLHRQMPVDTTMGARIVIDVNDFKLGPQPTTALSPGEPYTFPSKQLGFDKFEKYPTLSQMENTPSINVKNINGELDVPISETRVSYVEVPKIMVYQFPRLISEYNRETGQRIEYVNKTEVDMPLFHTINAKNGRRGILKLQGFIRHGLDSVVGGHYVAYLTQGGKYWRADDARVSEVSAAEYLIEARLATTAVYSTVQ